MGGLATSSLLAEQAPSSIDHNSGAEENLRVPAFFPLLRWVGANQGKFGVLSQPRKGGKSGW